MPIINVLIKWFFLNDNLSITFYLLSFIDRLFFANFFRGAPVLSRKVTLCFLTIFFIVRSTDEYTRFMGDDFYLVLIEKGIFHALMIVFGEYWVRWTRFYTSLFCVFTILICFYQYDFRFWRRLGWYQSESFRGFSKIRSELDWVHLTLVALRSECL